MLHENKIFGLLSRKADSQIIFLASLFSLFDFEEILETFLTKSYQFDNISIV